MRTYLKGISILFVITILSLHSQAVTYYWDPARGSDSNNGSSSKPWKTLDKIASSVSKGDIVNIKPGTYTKTQMVTSATMKGYGSIFNWTASHRKGARGYPITIQSTPGATRAVFDGEGKNAYFVFMNTKLTDAGLFVVFKNIDFRRWIHPVIRIQAKNVAVDGCKFSNTYDNTSAPINMLDAQYVIVRNSRFEVTGLLTPTYNNNADHGIYVAEGSKNVLIENNFFKTVNGFGIHAYGHSDLARITENLIIRKNIITNVGSSHVVLAGTRYKNVKIYNNTMYSSPNPFPNRSQDETVRSFDLRAKIFSDVAWQNNISVAYLSWSNFYLDPGITMSTSTILSNLRMGNNVWVNLQNKDKTHFWLGKYMNLAAFRSLTQKDTNSISVDPRFQSASTFDLRLKSGSPAINTGDFLSTTLTSGSGTTIPLSNVSYFTDGYGLGFGDLIQIGSNLVRVKSINTSAKTITVDRSISWTKGQRGSLPYKGSKPDMGAYEY